ncbi:hypothetical protein Tco_0648496 [Tanacetum coccineum]
MMKFSEISGLIPNMEKSTVFFRNVKDEVKDRIFDVLPFAVGMLLMKYVETRKGNQSTTSQVIHNHTIYTIGFIHYLIYTITQDNQDIDLVLRREKKKSLDYNNSFLGEYECSSLALDREERRDEKEEVGLLETRSNNVSGQEI